MGTGAEAEGSRKRAGGKRRGRREGRGRGRGGGRHTPY